VVACGCFEALAGPDQCLGKDVAVDDHHISSTPHSVFSRTPDPLCYQRILAFLTSFVHLYTNCFCRLCAFLACLAFCGVASFASRPLHSNH